MVYLSCQPAIPRYEWEVEVYLDNFLSLGVPAQDIHVVQGFVNGIDRMPDNWRRLRDKYAGVRFFFYPDTRSIENNYQPSLQAHILEKHWIHNRWLENESVFFHDSDFVFTRPFDFTKYLSDKVWYLSNTVSYIGARYILSKGDEILDAMCSVSGMDRDMLLQRDGVSGGAQKLIKNVTSRYWSEVFDMQMDLWREIPPISKSISDREGSGYHPLQIWTMSMWAELWVAWKMGFMTAIPNDFDFMFYTNHISDWNNMYFYHNAGVVSGFNGMFFKGKYDKGVLPYGDVVNNINTNLAGYRYYELVQETGLTTCLKN